MKRALLISLSLVLALVFGSTVYADDGFYVISGLKAKYAPVPKTGQTAPSTAGGDGALQKGVPWPNPRFTDNGNGTVTDKLTGLIWTKNANIFGLQSWSGALSKAATLASGANGLTDGSKAGDWRLPNLRELQSLVDYGKINPALPAVPPDLFTGVQLDWYWSSTTYLYDTTAPFAFMVFIGGDGTTSSYLKDNQEYVWCVRGGQ